MLFTQSESQFTDVFLLGNFVDKFLLKIILKCINLVANSPEKLERLPDFGVISQTPEKY